MFEYCFLIETFDGIKSVVTRVDSTGDKILEISTGMVNLIGALNTLGAEGWECVGYNSGYRNTLNFWTLKRAVIPQAVE